MKRFRFSIRTTLLLIIVSLNVFITGQVGYTLYKSWVSYQDAKTLKEAATTINAFFNAEKFLSRERGAATAIIYTSADIAESLSSDIKINRQSADKAFALGLFYLKKYSSGNDGVQPAIDQVNERYKTLEGLRKNIDANLLKPPSLRDPLLAASFFKASTDLIADIYKLIEAYTHPYLITNPSVIRQLRLSHLVWHITEYAGREYAILGQMIAEEKRPTHDIEEHLSRWRGRIQYGWELVHSSVLANSWAQQIQPILSEAETHYFMTYEQIKDIFEKSSAEDTNSAYPITVEMWLELASQAVDSLHDMNDAALDFNLSFVAGMEKKAQQGILFSLILFISALLLSFYSWCIIMARVINPINVMIDALYKATHGEAYEPPVVSYYEDEMSRLAGVLNVFQENSHQLEVERDKAEAASIAKSEFLANMSHEIRTPINVVLGLSSILGKSSPLTEKQKEFIATLQLSAESLLSIINDLLDFSKIETRSFELEIIPFNLLKVLEDVMAFMAVNAAEKGLALESDFRGIEGKEYTGDPTRIRQILTNLCGNAVKFTETGKVSLKAEARPAERPGYDDIIISVIDTGIGIESEKLDQIFDKFTQVDSSISRKYGGTGLGLAIAKTFAEMMGGKITAKSVYGQGATFEIHLSLPVKREEISEITHATPDANGKMAVMPETERILLVDDYPPNVLVARTYLEELGYQCDVAVNGAEAIEMVKQKKYFAVLMDVQMREMDGYQATQKIRQHEEKTGAPRTKIIGMTAHALVGDREKCLAAGMDDYLAKPYHLEDLKKKLLPGELHGQA
ncbi:MAG: ATP-binding protein [Micavibrio sp.]